MTQAIRRHDRASWCAANGIPLKGGIQFRLIAKHRRSVYIQLDGEVELADACTCTYDYEPFRVFPSSHCPIDLHRILALRNAA